MSEPTISLGGNLPKDEEYNGLLGIYNELVGTREQRAEERLCVVMLSVNYVKDKTVDGSKSPVLQITRVEPMRGDEERRRADALLTEAYELRTRRERMPFRTIEQSAEDGDAPQWEPGEIRITDIGGGISLQMTVLRGRFYVAPLGAPTPADSQPGTWVEYDDKLIKRLTGTARQQDRDLRAVFMSAQQPSAMDKLAP